METKALPTLPCLCASLRRATRSLTQLYEEAMRPTGLRSSQFTILQALSLAGEVTQGTLGQILAMDSTTLTRTLAIMGRHGWVERQRGDDRREWRIQISPAGRDQFRRALPYWERAQAVAKKKLGGSRWHQLMKLSNEIFARS